MSGWWRERPWSDEHARPEFDGEMPPGPGAARPTPGDEYLRRLRENTSNPMLLEAVAEAEARRAAERDATPLAPWGGPAPQPPHHARPERAMLARALLLGLVIGVLLAGCLGAFNWVDL